MHLEEVRLGHEEAPTGFVYFIEGGDLIKVGYSVEPEKRIKSLKTGSPIPLTLLGYIRGTRALEGRLHRALASSWSHGEWFQATVRLRNYIANRAEGPAASQLV